MRNKQTSQLVVRYVLHHMQYIFCLYRKKEPTWWHETVIIAEVQSYKMCYSMRLLPRNLDEEMDCQATVVKDDTKELCYHSAQEGEQGFQVS